MSTTPATIDLDAVDLEGFYAGVRALREEIDADLSPDDTAHLRRIERWGRLCTALGYATAWIAPNPVSALALCLGRSTRWMLMHHIGHRGYDKVPQVPERYTSKVFARGWRRMLDWADWMVPEAWIYEHNILHHQNTGELRDPDLIERNAEWLRHSRLPRVLRYALVAGLGATWKPVYYAPATLDAWLARHGEHGRDGRPPPSPWSTFLARCVAPYGLLQFVVVPALFAPLGPLAMASVWANSVAGEVLTNVHTFLVVGPNHTGDDLYRFDDRPTSKGEFYARQVIGSVNYRTGGDVNDWLHMWLNYQIEHHLFPDIPMRAYQRVQPKVKALCERFGVPYLQEPVTHRFGKMLDVFVGLTSMRKAPPRPRVRSTPRTVPHVVATQARG